MNIGVLGIVAGLASLQRLARHQADNSTSVKDAVDQPAQTNAVDPEIKPEPPMSRQVRRQLERREAKRWK